MDHLDEGLAPFLYKFCRYNNYRKPYSITSYSFLDITGTTIAVNQIRDNNTVVGTTTANLGQNFHIRCYGEYLAAA